MARARVDEPVTAAVRFGEAVLRPDPERPRGWLLEVDGVPQSYVDLKDPEHLEFEYVRLLGDLLDLAGPPGDPLTVLHLGGGGCTLARYVAATRPRSPQVVVEADDLLVELVRARLGTEGFKLRIGDARESLGRLTPGTSDVVIGDVFVGARLPVGCTTVEHVRQVRALLRPGGAYLTNLADGPPFGFARGQVATVAEVFAHVVVLAEPSVLRGRRFGNVVVAGSDQPFDVRELSRRAARAIGRARVLSGSEVGAFAGGARPVTDATAVDAPLPPASVFGR
ncbi:MAG: fused MFS/spermidine synthase [Actinobacteria bacterium]|nr:fused MFS/spermidine synthase [Actinomycetota bacterium]